MSHLRSGLYSGTKNTSSGPRQTPEDAGVIDFKAKPDNFIQKKFLEPLQRLYASIPAEDNPLMKSFKNKEAREAITNVLGIIEDAIEKIQGTSDEKPSDKSMLTYEIYARICYKLFDLQNKLATYLPTKNSNAASKIVGLIIARGEIITDKHVASLLIDALSRPANKHMLNLDIENIGGANPSEKTLGNASTIYGGLLRKGILSVLQEVKSSDPSVARVQLTNVLQHKAFIKKVNNAFEELVKKEEKESKAHAKDPKTPDAPDYLKNLNKVDDLTLENIPFYIDALSIRPRDQLYIGLFVILKELAKASAAEIYQEIEKLFKDMKYKAPAGQVIKGSDRGVSFSCPSFEEIVDRNAERVVREKVIDMEEKHSPKLRS